ncbi:MAG: hypothetical protein M3392_03195 [Actinomycetota bacterium]|nr:hypothetical protein [Actinomycetota bacterium]
MDPLLDLERRRLLISATLTTQARRCLGGCIPVDSGAKDLVVLARRLAEETNVVELAYDLGFDPSYPGITAGPQSAGDSLRLLLACRALDGHGVPIGVAFTTLIPGRAPQVSVAPAEAAIPLDWLPLSELS